MICKLIVLCLLVASPALSSAVKGHRDEPTGAAVKGGPLLAPVKSAQHREQSIKGHQREEAVKGHREESTKGQRREEATKGRELAPEPLAATSQREEPTKGSRLLFAPVEQQRLIEQHQASIKGSQVKLEEPSQKKIEQREDLSDKQWQQQQQQQQQVVQKEEIHQQRDESLAQQKLEEAPAAAPIKTVRYEARPQVAREELAKGQQQQQQLELAAKTEQKPWDDKVDLQQQQQLHQQQLAEAQELEHKESQQQQQQQQQRYDEQEQVQVEAHSEQRRLTESSESISQQHIEQRQEQLGATKGGQAPLVAPAGKAEPYAFDYSIEGSSRRESGDTNGVVRGQYTLQGADGSSRIVDYVADADGFRASVNTNEAGTESRAGAGVQIKSSQPAAEDISLRLEGKTREFLSPPAAVKAPAVPPKPDNWQVKAPAPLAGATKAAAEPLAQQHIEQVEIVRQQQQQLDWSTGAAKGDVEKILEPASQQAEPLAEQKPLLSAAQPIKQHEPLKEILQQQQQQPALAEVQESPKVPSAPSAELRSPKALLRSGFESATAHRPLAAAARPAARPAQPAAVRASPAHQVHHQRNAAAGRQPARYEPHYSHHYAPAALPVAASEDDSLVSFERSS